MSIAIEHEFAEFSRDTTPKEWQEVFAEIPDIAKQQQAFEMPFTAEQFDQSIQDIESRQEMQDFNKMILASPWYIRGNSHE